MDSAQWIQDIRTEKSMVDVANVRQPAVTERKARPQKDHAVDCPRCHSTNTKFCYYNNYSLTQPRYFCKNCRRYWTEGGTLRNVPVGGGSRKNKRSSLSTAPSSLSMSTTSSSLPLQSHKLFDLNPPNLSEFSSDHQNPKNHQGQDLNLGYPSQHDYQNGIPQFFEFPKMFETRDIMNSASSSSNTSSSTAPSLSALNLLRNGIGLNSFTHLAQGNLENNGLFTSNFSFNQECKPAIGFSFDGVNGGRLYANPNVSQENATANGSLGFPFGSVKRNVDEGDEGNKGHESNSNGYWNGMLGGGSW